MRPLCLRSLLLAILAMGSAAARPESVPSRGELLYSTHCIECHTTQMHWRDGRRATDWDSLKGQVRRWQGNAGLGWNDGDISDVARYLNETIYRYPQAPTAARPGTSGTPDHDGVNWTSSRR